MTRSIHQIFGLSRKNYKKIFEKTSLQMDKNRIDFSHENKKLRNDKGVRWPAVAGPFGALFV